MSLIAACVVYLDADPKQLQELLNTIAQSSIQKKALWANGIPSAGVTAVCDETHTIILGKGNNLGLAHAFNQFSRWAEDQGADYAVCFDEDSDITADSLTTLTREFIALKKAYGDQLAALGPRLIDRRTHRPMMQYAPYSLFRKTISGELLADHLISSAMIFDLQAYRAIGPFNESFFIDLVDIEWCLRARSKGYLLKVSTGAVLHQAIGLASRKLLGRAIYVHRPERNYYMVRNCIWLIRFAPMSTSRRFNEAFHLILRIIHLVLMGGWPLQRLSHIGRGMISGLGKPTLRSDQQTRI